MTNYTHQNAYSTFKDITEAECLQMTGIIGIMNATKMADDGRTFLISEDGRAFNKTKAASNTLPAACESNRGKLVLMKGIKISNNLPLNCSSSLGYTPVAYDKYLQCKNNENYIDRQINQRIFLGIVQKNNIFAIIMNVGYSNSL